MRFRSNRMKYNVDVFYTDTCKKENAFPTVYSNWDHTPRSGEKGSLFEDACPTKFRKAMEKAVDCVKDKQRDKQFIFVKSWNEWGKGNYLEPDRKFGRGYLEAPHRFQFNNHVQIRVV